MELNMEVALVSLAIYQHAIRHAMRHAIKRARLHQIECNGACYFGMLYSMQNLVFFSPCYR